MYVQLIYIDRVAIDFTRKLTSLAIVYHCSHLKLSVHVFSPLPPFLLLPSPPLTTRLTSHPLPPLTKLSFPQSLPYPWACGLSMRPTYILPAESCFTATAEYVSHSMQSCEEESLLSSPTANVDSDIYNIMARKQYSYIYIHR